MNEIVVLHIFTGSVLLAVGMAMKIIPPKKINSFYGYRTPRSMKSQHAWDEANSYSAGLMLWAGISTLLIQVISYNIVDGHNSILVSISYYTVYIVISIVLTERRLKARGF